MGHTVCCCGVVEWYHTTVVEWYSGTTQLLWSGIVVPHNCCGVVEWYHTTVVVWYSGTTQQHTQVALDDTLSQRPADTTQLCAHVRGTGYRNS